MPTAKIKYVIKLFVGVVLIECFFNVLKLHWRFLPSSRKPSLVFRSGYGDTNWLIWNFIIPLQIIRQLTIK